MKKTLRNLMRAIVFLTMKCRLGFLLKGVILFLSRTPLRRYIGYITREMAREDIPYAASVLKRCMAMHPPRVVKTVGKTDVLTRTRFPDSVKLHALNKLLDALEGEGVRGFLAFGTLLGAVRDKGFIPGDTDLDIGVLGSETSLPGLRRMLRKAGFWIFSSFSRELPWSVKVFLPGHHVFADIIFFHEINGRLCTAGDYAGHAVIRKRTLFSLADMDFMGRKVHVPEAPGVFLTEQYGDWSTKPDFHHFLLSTPMNDFSVPILRYCLLEVYWFHLTRERKNNAEAIIRLAKSRGIGNLREMEIT